MSIWLTDIADVLRRGGLSVIEAPGWRTRGWKSPYSTPDGGLRALTGGLVHHTGTPLRAKGDYPTWDTIVNGRSDVPGPLSQLGLGRGGDWYVFAAGRANHSGAVDDVRFSNPQCLGVEAEHDGVSAWPVRQYLSYVTGCAVLARHYGIPWRAHKEAAVPYGRKPDPIFDMAVFRKDLGGTSPRPPQEDDDMFNDDDRARLHKALYAIDKIALPSLGRIEQRTVSLVTAAGQSVDVDAEEVARLVLATLTPAAIAGAIPDGVAGSVADEIARRLGVA